MLEEYHMLRKEKEEEKQRQRVISSEPFSFSFTNLSILPYTTINCDYGIFRIFQYTRVILNAGTEEGTE